MKGGKRELGAAFTVFAADLFGKSILVLVVPAYERHVFILLLRKWGIERSIFFC